MFQAFTAQILRFVVFCDLTPCIFVGEYCRFGGTCCLPAAMCDSVVTVFSVDLRSDLATPS
jgi:hypothetical protein